MTQTELFPSPSFRCEMTQIILRRGCRYLVHWHATALDVARENPICALGDLLVQTGRGDRVTTQNWGGWRPASVRGIDFSPIRESRKC